MRSREIENYKKSLKLSKEQRETLVGTLLGDGCLETQNEGKTFRLKIEQSAQHRPYVEHLHELFKPWVRTGPRKRNRTASTGSETTSCGFNTLSHAAFRFYAHQYYADGVKQVPKLIHRWLTRRGLAYWFMDDGSMKSSQSKGVIFNTQGFTRSGVQRLIEVLCSRFELEAKRRHQKDGDQIYISGRSFERFSNLIDSFLIPSMRYKLPQPRRTHLPKE